MGSLKGEEPTDFNDSTESESDEAWRESEAAAAALSELTMALAPSWIAFQSNDSESGDTGLRGATSGSVSVKIESSKGRGWSAGAAGVGTAFFFFLGIAELMHSCSRSSSESMDNEEREELREKQTGVSSTAKALGI